MFVDASYEGDLMARAGVSYRVSTGWRTSGYGETFNGMQIRDNRFNHLVDPWKAPGRPGSGLLDGIEGPAMIICLCRGDLTHPGLQFPSLPDEISPSFRIPFYHPADYRPESYELLRRYLRARLEGDVFGKVRSHSQGNRVDMNNHGAVSTDFIRGKPRLP